MHSSWACCIVGYFIPHSVLAHCILAHSVKFSRSSGCFTHTGNLHEEIERKVLFQKLMTRKIYTHISIQFNSYLKWLFQKVIACIKRLIWVSLWTTGPGSAQGPALFRGNVSEKMWWRQMQESDTHLHTHTLRLGSHRFLSSASLSTRSPWQRLPRPCFSEMCSLYCLNLPPTVSLSIFQCYLWFSAFSCCLSDEACLPWWIWRKGEYFILNWT